MKQILLVILILLNITAFAIKPERVYKWTPATRGLAYMEYQVETPDKFAINVWEYGVTDSAKTTRTVIFVGSDAGNMSYMIYHAFAFLEKGIRVVSFDYRGFGKSADFEINSELLFHPEFALDLDSVIKATRAKYPNDIVGLYAMSMGTYISLIRKEKIDFLVAEGFYSDPLKVVDRIKINRNRAVLLPAGAKAIQKLRNTPVLIFCASDDKTTVTADAREFSKKNKVRIIEFKGEHLQGISIMTKETIGDEYSERVLEFLMASKL